MLKKGLTIRGGKRQQGRKSHCLSRRVVNRALFYGRKKKCTTWQKTREIQKGRDVDSGVSKKESLDKKGEQIFRLKRKDVTFGKKETEYSFGRTAIYKGKIKNFTLKEKR